MSQDLAQWLLAQIAEDEREALAALDQPPFACACLGPLPECVCARRNRRNREHLAECEAKRAIIGMHRSSLDSFGKTRAYALEDVLRLLALPYADRPGYREEWRP